MLVLGSPSFINLHGLGLHFRFARVPIATVLRRQLLAQQSALATSTAVFTNVLGLGCGSNEEMVEVGNFPPGAVQQVTIGGTGQIHQHRARLTPHVDMLAMLSTDPLPTQIGISLLGAERSRHPFAAVRATVLSRICWGLAIATSTT
jgi:hypothetical protein